MCGLSTGTRALRCPSVWPVTTGSPLASLCFVAVGVRTVALPARYRSCGSVACMASRGVRSFENSPFHWDLCLIFLFLVLAFSIFQNSLLCS